MICGCKPSVMDGTEHEFLVQASLPVPEAYSYVKQMPKVLNQGSNPICVCCSISSVITYKQAIEGNSIEITEKEAKELFKTCGGTDDGMQIKDALKYIRHNGYKTKKGTYKINEYLKVGGVQSLKYALLMNGVCIGALPVYSDTAKFWEGDTFQGGHAIAIVGWNKEGFIIRNSWGSSWADHGYTTLPYDEINKFYEIWTIN